MILDNYRRYLSLFMALTTPVSGIEIKAKLSKNSIYQGSVFAVRMPMADGVKEIILKWKDVETKAVPDPNQERTWLAVFAVPHDADTSNEPIRLTVKEFEHESEQTLPFAVKPGKFGREKLTVDPAKVKLSTEDKARVKQEAEEVRAIYASTDPTPLWKGKFQPPATGEIRSVYGTNRMFNGEQKNHHSGVDYRAAVGTKIYAAANGRVRLAKNLFFSGNMVLLEHGAGVFTIYAHMSKIKVKADDMVKAGDVLGYSGATGRVNGPHLHWGVRIHGIEADPLELLTVF